MLIASVVPICCLTVLENCMFISGFCAFHNTDQAKVNQTKSKKSTEEALLVAQIAIEPKSKGDSDKMGNALYKLAQEDPSFHYSRDNETNQTVIEGMGELHLDIIVDRMKREFNVGADVGAPQVCPYIQVLTTKHACCACWLNDAALLSD